MITVCTSLSIVRRVALEAFLLFIMRVAGISIAVFLLVVLLWPTRTTEAFLLVVRSSNCLRQSSTTLAAIIKGVLFDKDGTLIDFEATFGPATAAVIRDLAAGNAETQEALCRSVQYDPTTNTFDSRSVVLAGSVRDIADAFLEPLLLLDPPDEEVMEDDNLFVKQLDELYRKHSLTSLSAFDYTASTLQELKRRGLTLGIATNDSEAAARQHMTQLGLGQYFSKILGFDSGFGAKPEAGMVTAFCDDMVPPHQILMVGDTLHDCEAGKRAGAWTVGVTTGLWTRDELVPHADYVLRDISELPALIARLEEEEGDRAAA